MLDFLEKYTPILYLLKKLNTTTKYLANKLVQEPVIVIGGNSFTGKVNPDNHRAFLQGVQYGIKRFQEVCNPPENDENDKLTKEDNLWFLQAIFKVLDLNVNCSAETYRIKYIYTLEEIKERTLNMRFLDRKMESIRLKFLRKLENRIQNLDLFAEKHFVVRPYEEYKNELDQTANDMYAWGNHVGYISGLLYTYEKYGIRDFKNEYVLLQALMQRCNNMSRPVTVNEELFEKTKKQTLNRIKNLVLQANTPVKKEEMTEVTAKSAANSSGTLAITSSETAVDLDLTHQDNLL